MGDGNKSVSTVDQAEKLFVVGDVQPTHENKFELPITCLNLAKIANGIGARNFKKLEVPQVQENFELERVPHGGDLADTSLVSGHRSKMSDSKSTWPRRSNNTRMKGHSTSSVKKEGHFELRNGQNYEEKANFPINGERNKTATSRGPRQNTNTSKIGRFAASSHGAKFFEFEVNQKDGESKEKNSTIRGRTNHRTASRQSNGATRKNIQIPLVPVNNGRDMVNNFPIRGQRMGVLRGRGPRQISAAYTGKNLVPINNGNMVNNFPIRGQRMGASKGRGPSRQSSSSYTAKNHQLTSCEGARKKLGNTLGVLQNYGPGQRVAPMNRFKMKELEVKDPTEVMFTLCNPKEGFTGLLKQPQLGKDKLVLILSLLAKACKSEQKESLKALVKSIQSIHQFSYVTLQSFLCELENGASILSQESLGNLLSFLETTQDLDPKNLTIDILLPQLKEINSEMENSDGQQLTARLNILETKRSQLKEKYHVSFLCRTQADPPPNNFRTIHLFPDKDDLSDKPHFLRPNIVNGSYQDTEHYLDVQFRLLREDFVRPLREGIAEYVNQLGSQHHRKLQNVRAYTNVHVQKALMTDDGIVHEVSFDVRPFRDVDWESSKRMMFGTLLCFSQDNFKTVIFGTVAKRNPLHLSEGRLHVRFEDHNLAVLPTATYVMLESTEAYFEGYRHNLIALQLMDESTLPFKEFIVEVSRQVGPPFYLKDHTKYCLKPVLKSLGGNFRTSTAKKRDTVNNTDEDGSLRSANESAVNNAYQNGGMHSRPTEGCGTAINGNNGGQLRSANEGDAVNNSGENVRVSSYSAKERGTVNNSNENGSPDSTNEGPVNNTNEDGNLRSAKGRTGNPVINADRSLYSTKGRDTDNNTVEDCNIPSAEDCGTINNRDEYNCIHGTEGCSTLIIPEEDGMHLPSAKGSWINKNEDGSIRNASVCGTVNNTGDDVRLHSALAGLGNVNICPPCNFREILNDTDWPTCTDMGLDPSQFEAFKLAITKQLAIIQGPPGTGKTHVGLKIVEALLHNHEAWTTPGKKGQILVICYTNHALDQFLEGVLKCTNSIVRIGGRCKSEVLLQYTMAEQRNCMAGEIKGTTYIRENELNNREKRENILNQIHGLEQKIMEFGRAILSEDALKDAIGRDHFRSLVFDCPYRQMRKLKPKISCWLGFGIPGEYLEESEMDSSYSENATSAKVPVTSKYEDEFQNTDYDLGIDGGNPTVIADRNRALAVNNGGWRVQGGKKHTINVSRDMDPLTPMPDQEVRRVRNVWGLSYDNRRRLYKSWMEKFQHPSRCKLEDLKQKYLDALKMDTELRNEKNLIVARDKIVVGMTTTGAAIFRSLMRRIQPQIIIVEEAAEVFEAHIVTALTESTEHLILIGDHQQLRPNPTVYDLAKRYKLDVSLFERLINNGVPYCRLGIQHRMRPCIAKLIVPHIYESLEDHKSVKEYEDIRGIEKSMFFINHDSKETTVYDSASRKNYYEAEFLVRLCRYLLLQGYGKQQITILATYTGQLLLLKRLMNDVCKDVRVAVVDNYQGEENDIILLSLVRSNEEGTIGFLKVHNRVCVALSRAKKGLYCTGNLELLRNESKLWENIYEELLAFEAVGPSLKVRCKNHGTAHDIKEPSDFDNVVDGGCSEHCDFQLGCGHACELRCHPLDPDHEEYKCKKPCTKVLCSLEHKCPKLCHQKCGKCEIPVVKVIPTCGHEDKVPCHRDVAKITCKILVVKAIPACGHEVKIPCHRDAVEIRCEAPVVKVIPACGHEVEVPCHLDPALEKCKMPCQKTPECGHRCELLCSDLCGSCKMLITLKGLCGHDVSIECGVYAENDDIEGRCTEKCERPLSCKHPCPNACGEDCPQDCCVIIEYSSPCGHLVNIPCHLTQNEDSVLARCPHPCEKILECGHFCAGTCSKCRQGKIHILCKKRCGKRLICGHVCAFPCCQNCPSTCQEECKQRCPHDQCQHPCFLPCYPCRKPCTRKCKHIECTKECGEPCNRPPCTEPCPRILKCQHECIGFCGEPCPEMCRICDHQEVTKIFFGHEEDPHARFVALEECGHVFEVDGLEQWIEVQKTKQIKLLSCPKCNIPIFYNVRFSNAIKNMFANVEKAKGSCFEQVMKIKNNRFNTLSNFRTEHSDVFEFGGKYVDKPFLKGFLNEKSEIYPKIVISILQQLRKQNSSAAMIVQMENLMSFARQMKSIEKILSDETSSIDERFSNHIVSSLSVIAKRLTENVVAVSTQLMVDISWELHRVVLLTNLVKTLGNQIEDRKPELKAHFAYAAETLMKLEPFAKEQLRQLEDLKIDIGSKEIKASIKKPLNLRQCRWYHCRNGHIYYMDVDNMVAGFCSKCQANHQQMPSSSSDKDIPKYGLPTRKSGAIPKIRKKTFAKKK